MLPAAGVDITTWVSPLYLIGGLQVVYVSNVWGVTAGLARHNSSNVGGVTAGQV